MIKLAEFLKYPVDNLLTVWLADKILDTINKDKKGEDALKLALKNYKKKWASHPTMQNTLRTN